MRTQRSTLLATSTPRLTITASWLHVEGGDSPALSGALQQYYRAVVTNTLGDSEQLCVTILRDVASKGKIAPLLPYLITFIRQAMKRFPTKSLLQTRMLRLISAIFSNPQLNLSPKPYLSHLVTALLTTVLCQDVSSVDPRQHHPQPGALPVGHPGEPAQVSDPEAPEGLCDL